MDKIEDMTLLLAEEQPLPSRERTMHSDMQTDLAFTSVGLLIMKFLSGVSYFCAGPFFIILGALLTIESGKRYMRFRRAICLLQGLPTDNRGRKSTAFPRATAAIVGFTAVHV